MSQFLLGVLITAVVTAIVVPLVNHYLAKRREYRATVRIDIQANEFLVPSPVKSALKPLSVLETTSTKPTPIAPDDQLRILRRVRSYIRVTLSNNTDKKLTGVIVYITSKLPYDLVYQIDDDATLLGPDIKELFIGDIYPGHHRTIHCWGTVSLSNTYPRFLSDLFRISADELKHRAYEFPLPNYLSDLYLPLAPNTMAFIQMVARFLRL